MAATKKKTKSTTKKTSARRKTPPRPQLHRLKVTLRGSRPPIWRRFLISSDLSLGSLHTLLQAVMGWTNAHLHAFEAKGMRISDPDFDLDADIDGESTVDEERVVLRALVPRVGDTIVYEYDFGDSWLHDIVVEAIEAAEPDALPIWCIEGEGACPPEDCGGMGGFESFLEAVRNATHPEHADMVAWVGGSFDADAFDARAVNRELTRWVLSRV